MVSAWGVVGQVFAYGNIHQLFLTGLRLDIGHKILVQIDRIASVSRVPPERYLGARPGEVEFHHGAGRQHRGPVALRPAAAEFELIVIGRAGPVYTRLADFLVDQTVIAPGLPRNGHFPQDGTAPPQGIFPAVGDGNPPGNFLAREVIPKSRRNGLA